MDNEKLISKLPESDEELFTLMRTQLYTPVVGDILDDLGYYHQFLTPKIQPMKEHMKLAGRAMPVLLADVFEPQDQPFGLMTEALDQLQPGEVYITSGSSRRSACWGEILTATAKKRGAAGAVIDGYHRDTPQVLEQNWPVFSHGRFAQDSRVRTSVADYRCCIEIGTVTINPGDIVFADLDGVIIIPQDVEREVVKKALQKVSGEKTVRKEIENGMSSTDAFKKYDIL